MMQKFLAHILLSGFAFFFLSASISSHAAETIQAQVPEKSQEPSFLERYTDQAQDILLKGLELVGIKYKIGGTNPFAGLDCSAYVQMVFKEATGLILPRTAKEQASQGVAVSFSDLKPGDLVFFNTMRSAFSHVGIYLGDHYFLHAPRAGGTVRLESMANSYWVQRYNGARRVLDQ